jgi:RNA polymerase-binding transcription factor DksA
MLRHEMETFRDELLKLEEHIWDDFDFLGDEVFHRTDGMATGNLSNIPVDDRSELSSDNSSRQATITLLESASDRLIEINAALQRIDEGSFGKCEDCGRQITRTRLQAIPMARQCLECAGDADQDETAAPGNL